MRYFGWIVVAVLVFVVGGGALLIAWSFNYPLHTAPVASPAADTTGIEVVAESTQNDAEFIWQTDDSVGIRVRYIPHGKGVVVEVQPVRKVKKLPAKGKTGGKK